MKCVVTLVVFFKIVVLTR